MSIQSEITRITGSRDQSFTALSNKGVTIPSGSSIDDLPGYIAALPETIKGSGVPTTSTAGLVGQHYFNTSATESPYEYVCTDATGSVYTWEPIGAKGDTGDSGVYYGTTTPTDPDVTVWIDPSGTGISIPTKTSDLINDSGFVNSTGAAAAAPVQSVNGQTGAVTIPLATEGLNYCKMPDGTLIQWGEEQNKSNQAQITFVAAYDSHPTVFLTPVYNYQRTVRCSLGVVATTTGFTMYAYDTDTQTWSTSTDLRFYWVAVGRWK